MTPATDRAHVRRFRGLAPAAAGCRASRKLDQTHSDLPKSAKGRASSGFTASVPVWFHVVTDGETGELSDARDRGPDPRAQHDVRRRRGRRRHRLQLRAGRRDAHRRRRLVLREPGRRQRADDEVRRCAAAGPRRSTCTRRPPATTSAGPTCRTSSRSRARSTLDGVVVDWESFLGTSDTYEDQYDQGETTTHEVGSLAEPRAHVLRRLQRQGRLRRGHAAGEDRDERLPRGQGHVHGARRGPDPQLHGLLVRRLLHGVHRGPGSADGRRLAALPSSLAATPVPVR